MKGITLDNPWAYKKVIATLKTLKQKIHVRVVFDLGVDLKEYIVPIVELNKYAFIMGQPVDSFSMKELNLNQYTQRMYDLKFLFKDYISMWEVGNEVNGDWLGEDVRKKLEISFEIFKDCQKVITLYADQELTYYSYLNENRDLCEKAQYIFISEYPQDNNAHIVNLNKFAKAMSSFSAYYGYGECGTKVIKDKKARFQNYYVTIQNKMKSKPNWVGGYFWWYQKDFEPKGLLVSNLQKL